MLRRLANRPNVRSITQRRALVLAHRDEPFGAPDRLTIDRVRNRRHSFRESGAYVC